MEEKHKATSSEYVVSRDNEEHLAQLGVSAVNASDIERNLYERISFQASSRTGDPDEEHKDRILGLNREIWALRSALYGTELQEEKEEKEARGVQDPLQRAVMEQRLNSLEKERDGICGQKKSLKNANLTGPENTSAKKQKKKRKKIDATLTEADLFDNAVPKRDGAGSLIETERDRLIRLGVLTPFDNLGEFERRIEGEQSYNHRIEATIQQVGEKVREIKASRHTSKLLDPSELPKPQREAKKVREGFWRAAAGKISETADGKRSRHRQRTLKNNLHPTSSDDKTDARGVHDDLEDDTFVQRQVASQFEQGDTKEEQDVIFQGGYRIPGYIYSKLFDYQRTGIKWLWELYTQRVGGIMGDEMGLGKTIQIAAFLAGLHHSGMFKPTLIVCPATMLRQWLRELREWYPPFRVGILHESARQGEHGTYSRAEMIHRIAKSPSGVLITTYDHMRICKKELLSVRWGYVVLDEGHKIRNPDAEVTLTAKQLPTVHRLIMSGSPIQNRLVELWSLFDFVFPGKLGTLPIFQAQFAIPIQQGGYSNASSLQVATAYKCAVLLRDMISPYLLRRRKADVATALPKKTERVLFCSLTNAQRDMYLSYLSSKELSEILNGDRGALVGIDILRKICNHPDLLERTKWDALSDYGNPERSGKMLVLEKLLAHWISQENKALVFTQTQQTLDILEKMLINKGWTYHRMDGSTAIGLRSRLIDDFNTNPEISVFLLTTRVGGLGINLTGASKCVIFDPDWNPSTDVQARERAWRIGQTKEVTIYRLIVSGTIEEKVYHRQVYKQFLTEKVLRDPRQKRFFKAKDLSDLFTLGDEYAEGTETAAIFSSLGTEIHGINSAADDETEPPSEEQATEQRLVPRPDASSIFQSNEEKCILREEHVNDKGDLYNPTEEGQGDAKILKELFDGQGLHSALDHSKIEGAHDPSSRVAQKEAEKIASKAARALQQSRRSLQATSINMPTWTGRSGRAGAPMGPQKPRFGQMASEIDDGPMKSSQLLARIRSMNNTSADALSPEVIVAQRLAERVTAFLLSRGGSATSSALALQFRGDSGDPEMFRSVLKQVATLKRVAGGKQWHLKQEFC